MAITQEGAFYNESFISVLDGRPRLMKFYHISILNN